MQINPGTPVTIPLYAVPADWPTTGEVVEVGAETTVIELDNGERQEVPTDEITVREPWDGTTADATEALRQAETLRHSARIAAVALHETARAIDLGLTVRTDQLRAIAQELEDVARDRSSAPTPDSGGAPDLGL